MLINNSKHVYPTPLTRTGCDTRLIFMRGKADLISEFSFLSPCLYNQNLYSTTLPTGASWIHSDPKSISRNLFQDLKQFRLGFETCLGFEIASNRVWNSLVVDWKQPLRQGYETASSRVLNSHVEDAKVSFWILKKSCRGFEIAPSGKWNSLIKNLKQLRHKTRSFSPFLFVWGWCLFLFSFCFLLFAFAFRITSCPFNYLWVRWEYSFDLYLKLRHHLYEREREREREREVIDTNYNSHDTMTPASPADLSLCRWLIGHWPVNPHSSAQWTYATKLFSQDKQIDPLFVSERSARLTTQIKLSNLI